MSTVGQVIADPDFAKLSPQDQQGVLTHFDPDFAKVNAAEFPRVVEGIRNKGVPSNQQAEKTGPSPSRKVGNITIPAGVERSGNPSIPQADEGPFGTVSAYSDKPETAASLGKKVGAMAFGAGAGAVAQVAAAPFLAGGALGGPKLVEAAQEEIPAAGEKAKALWPLLKDAYHALGAGEVAGAQAESSAWKDVMDSAYEGAAEATRLGNHATAVIYNGAAQAAKLIGNLNAGYAAAGKATRGVLPAVVALTMYYDFAKDTYHYFTTRGDREEDEK
jgi:hypothetical protein